MTITESLWDRYGQLRIDDLPEEARTVAGQCVLDWFGCALVGSREPLSEILRSELGAAPGSASIVGTDLRTAPGAAALINGAAGHALDFDDTHTIMGGHPTAPVFPAALALAQELDSSGADLLTAYVVGVEIESRLGALIGPAHYAKGWHVTSTIGIFGATAAACHLLGANGEQFGHAMGLAGSQSSGLKANFGTMTKPFHAGHAAERGLLSARLAAKGFTANPAVIDAKQGLAEAASSGAEGLGHAQVEKYEDQWLITHTLFKYHAACYLTHAAIESVAALRRELSAKGISASEVAEAVVTVHPSLLNVCGIPRPRTGLEAKFSLTATTALSLLEIDTTDTATFVDATLENEELQRLIDRVHVETDSDLRGTQARVRLSSLGESYEALYDTGVPATDLGGQGEKLRAKFNGLVAPVLGDEAAAGLATSALNLGDLADLAQLRGFVC